MKKNNFLSAFLEVEVNLILIFLVLSAATAQAWSEQSSTCTPPAVCYSAANTYDETNDCLSLFSRVGNAPAILPQVGEANGILPVWVQDIVRIVEAFG